MMNIQNVAVAFSETLENVMAAKLRSSAHLLEPLCLDGYEIIGAVPFEGDCSEILIMVISKNDADAFAQSILKRFSLQTTVANDIIFSEILNIYAGHLSTKMKDLYNTNINIGSPVDDLTIFDRSRISDALVASFDNGLTVKFHFLKDINHEYPE